MFSKILFQGLAVPSVLLLLCCCCGMPQLALGQVRLQDFSYAGEVVREEHRISAAVAQAHRTGVAFHRAAPLKISQSGSRTQFSAQLQDHLLLSLDKSVLAGLHRESPAALILHVPGEQAAELVLELVQVQVFSDDFSIRTEQEDAPPVAGQPPSLHYRGVVRGHSGSVVAISLLPDGIMGIVADGDSEWVLSPLNTGDPVHILYDKKKLMLEHPFSCDMDEMAADERMSPEHDAGAMTPGATDKCVRVFIECDYALFQEKRGVQETADWMAAVFNNVAALYQLEGVTLELSEMLVWTTQDPYSRTNSVTALNQFRALRSKFNGSIAHLAALGGKNIGGVAWLDVACNYNYRFGYSNIHATVEHIPVFSWTVEVITHEIGHNLGSRHTQWCGWPGGPIDNCYPAEGRCIEGPAPVDGGTIMSYCHLTPHGINFAHGFGPLPGDRIRARVSSAACLYSCGDLDQPVCTTPSGLQISSIAYNSVAITWIKVKEADSYVLQIKQVGRNGWTEIEVDTSYMAIDGLAPQTTYEVRIRAACDTLESSFSSNLVFETPAESAYCAARGLDSFLEWIEYVELQEIRRSSQSDNGYYDATHYQAILEAGRTYTMKFKPGFNGGVYNTFWRVWIDLDQDGSFDDAGELIFSRIANNASMMTRGIRLPANTPGGVTRMRIAMRHGSHAQPCGVFENGEVEDYSILVVPSGKPADMEAMPGAPGDELASQVYPNPVHDGELRVWIDGVAEGQRMDVTVFNLLGQEVGRRTFRMDADGGQMLTMDIGHLSSGNYLLTLSGGDRQMQHSFMKF